jgi:LIM domain kinase 1
LYEYLFFRLDMSSDLMSLHIGDRILEVNGTPVKDQPIENIENLIRYSDTVLQVGSLRIISLDLVCG